jgi:hypothetical protein
LATQRTRVFERDVRRPRCSLFVATRRILLEHHLNVRTRQPVKLDLGLIITMEALWPGLFVALPKGSYTHAADKVGTQSRLERQRASG